MSYQSFIQDDSPPIDLSGAGLIRSYGGWKSIAKFQREHETKIGDERILGSSAFVQCATLSDDLNVDKVTGANLGDVITGVCKYFEVAPENLTKRGRENSLSRAKAVIAYVACELVNIPYYRSRK